MKLILSAGMPRSGSTLLFNMLRLVLFERYGSVLQCGWETLLGDNHDQIGLIKTHSLTPQRIQEASIIFYTFRDPRVAMVSHKRLFPRELTIEDVHEWILQYYLAIEGGAHIFQYEEWIPDRKREMLCKIAEILGIPIDVDCVYGKLEAIRPPTFETLDYSRETLLFPGHFTHTGSDEWRSVLPLELQKEINDRFSYCLKENGYIAE